MAAEKQKSVWPLVIKLVIYIVLIIILVYLLWYFYSKYALNRNNSTSDIIDEEYIPDPTPIINSTNILRDQYNHLAGLELCLGKSCEKKKVMKTLDFRTFVHLVENDSQFISRYLEAVRVSFYLKLQTYKKFLRDEELAIRSYEQKDKEGGFLFSITSGVTHHDSSYERHKYARSQLQEIIKTIRERARQITPQKIKQNLQTAIYDQKNGFASLIGRNEIKDKLVQMIYSFSNSPENFINNFQNVLLVGDAGVGKTKMAESMAFIFSHSCILARGNIEKVTKTDLTSSYVSESEQITRNILYRSLEGILLLEEIYALGSSKMADKLGAINHGKDSMTEIVYFIDIYKGKSINIGSGYKDKIDEEFLGPNQGMRRRFPHYIDLPYYNSVQLTNLLLEFMLKNNPNMVITRHEQDYIYTLVDYIYKNAPYIFKEQAGAMLNLASDLVTTINSSIEFQWTPGNWAVNKELIDLGFDSYLNKYGLSINSAHVTNSNPVVPLP